MFPASIRVIDSHTEGEPTRVVLDGWPQPSGDTMAARRESMRRDAEHLRRAVICEPRGHDALVGAIVTPPTEPDSIAGVIFFNNVGYLGMCGHGTIGVVRTLEYLGRLAAGTVRLDTPVGTVAAELDADGTVTIRNVAARCHACDVAVDVPGLGRIVGDIAYGGNWFFITHLADQPLMMARQVELSRLTIAIMDALRDQGITGANGAEIDHVELSAPDGRNFVMCPGGAYDRSPCGTGTSAKLATLHARGLLAPGQVFEPESITGGRFTSWLEQRDGELIPFIRGRAFVTGETTLRFDTADPFRAGFPEV
ncbi:MAG TPA: proline racemase family protein [Gemmatimonadaceae bacterium]|nr:proline racemase family protein [Gemmatimonadaceae bacterium]